MKNILLLSVAIFFIALTSHASGLQSMAAKENSQEPYFSGNDNVESAGGIFISKDEGTTDKNKWKCFESHLSCACINICGDFGSVAQMVFWTVYWEQVWCPGAVEESYA